MKNIKSKEKDNKSDSQAVGQSQINDFATGFPRDFIFKPSPEIKESIIRKNKILKLKYQISQMFYLDSQSFKVCLY